MIVFKQTSKDGSKICYSFSATGLFGTVIINKETSEIAFVEIKGQYQSDEKEKEQLLYIAKKKITSMNFPERCIYATH
jgi:hypothetical protein